MRVAAERLGHDLLEPGLDRFDGLAGREAGAVRHAKNVRINRERFLPKGGVEHDIGGLAPDAGQRLQFVAGPRNRAAVVADQRLRQSDDVLGLGVEQADRLDRLAQVLLAKFHHLLGRVDAGEERAGCDVDAGIGRLRRHHHGDEQLVRIVRFKLGLRRRVCLGQPPEEFENLVAGHSADTTSRME
ncbi:hypothetical protein GCM10023325_10570 [Sphingomonas lutea]